MATVSRNEKLSVYPGFPAEILRTLDSEVRAGSREVVKGRDMLSVEPCRVTFLRTRKRPHKD